MHRLGELHGIRGLLSPRRLEFRQVVGKASSGPLVPDSPDGPGSSLYVVWSQGRTGFVPSWDPSLRSNWDALWRTQPDNVLLVKVSYWFSP